VLVDALAYVLAVGLLSSPQLGPNRALGIVGPPLAVLVAALGLSSLHRAPIDGAVHTRASFLSAPVDATSHLIRGR
jgi:hypothetical protein